MTHGSLFSGIGGFDLAAQWMGWENKFHCEWNDFGRKVLNYYWPNAKTYEDITKTDFKEWRGKIDILTGGFPCQPYSVAGKREGKNDSRHLWPEMLRAVREIKPRWVVAENVRGLTSWNGGLVFEEVQAELEAEGYTVQSFLLPAAGVNAPHKRERIWIVAYSDHSNDRRTPGQDAGEGREKRVQERDEIRQSAESGEVFRNVADAKSQQSERDEPEQREVGEQEQRQFGGEGSEMGGFGDAADAHSGRPEGSEESGRHSLDAKREGSDSSQKRPTTNTDSERSQERNHAGQPEKPRRYDQTLPSPEDWEEFPTQSPVRDGDDGFSSRLDSITFPKWRNESIKAGGNAIVPQVVLQIFKAIEVYEYAEELL